MPRTTRTTALTATIILGLAAAFATGCSTPAPNAADQTPATSSSSADPTADTSVLPPIMIDGTEKTVVVKVGDNLDIISKGVRKVSSNNDAVLVVNQPQTDGSAQFNAGGVVIGPGTARLAVDGEGGTLYTVTVKAELPEPDGASVLPPLTVDGSKTVMDATVGDMLNVVAKDATSVSTDNADVLQVSQPYSEGGPGTSEFNAGARVIAPGTATLTVKSDTGTLYTVTINAIAK